MLDPISVMLFRWRLDGVDESVVEAVEWQWRIMRAKARLR